MSYGDSWVQSVKLLPGSTNAAMYEPTTEVRG